MDYLENQCVRERWPEYCEFELHADTDLGYADIQLSARSAEEVGTFIYNSDRVTFRDVLC